MNINKIGFIGLFLTTFMVVGQWIKETIYLLLFQNILFENVSRLEISAYFANYYFLMFICLIGFGFMSLTNYRKEKQK